jgi:hypothetical protein
MTLGSGRKKPTEKGMKVPQKKDKKGVDKY